MKNSDKARQIKLKRIRFSAIVSIILLLGATGIAHQIRSEHGKMVAQNNATKPNNEALTLADNTLSDERGDANLEGYPIEEVDFIKSLSANGYFIDDTLEDIEGLSDNNLSLVDLVESDSQFQPINEDKLNELIFTPLELAQAAIKQLNFDYEELALTDISGLLDGEFQLSENVISDLLFIEAALIQTTPDSIRSEVDAIVEQEMWGFIMDDVEETILIPGLLSSVSVNQSY